MLGCLRRPSLFLGGRLLVHLGQPSLCASVMVGLTIKTAGGQKLVGIAPHLMVHFHSSSALPSTLHPPLDGVGLFVSFALWSCIVVVSCVAAGVCVCVCVCACVVAVGDGSRICFVSVTSPGKANGDAAWAVPPLYIQQHSLCAGSWERACQRRPRLEEEHETTRAASDYKSSCRRQE